MTLVAVFVELFCDSYNIILLIGSDSDYDSPNELSASVPVVSDKAVNTTVSTGGNKWTINLLELCCLCLCFNGSTEA